MSLQVYGCFLSDTESFLYLQLVLVGCVCLVDLVGLVGLVSSVGLFSLVQNIMLSLNYKPTQDAAPEKCAKYSSKSADKYSCINFSISFVGMIGQCLLIGMQWMFGRSYAILMYSLFWLNTVLSCHCQKESL